eukprot:2291884-Pyramimonas_sp.AAC.1
MDLMSAHNFELGNRAQDKILARWELVGWNLQDSATRAFLAAGDFSIKSRPSRSCVDPVSEGFAPGSVPAERSRGSQLLQAYWECLFSMLAEMSTDCLACYCRDTAAPATLDR